VRPFWHSELVIVIREKCHTKCGLYLFPPLSYCNSITAFVIFLLFHRLCLLVPLSIAQQRNDYFSEEEAAACMTKQKIHINPPPTPLSPAITKKSASRSFFCKHAFTADLYIRVLIILFFSFARFLSDSSAPKNQDFLFLWLFLELTGGTLRLE
jgi:hypothetical protein